MGSYGATLEPELLEQPKLKKKPQGGTSFERAPQTPTHTMTMMLDYFRHAISV